MFFLNALSSSWEFALVVGVCGVLGFVVSCYGAYKACKAEAAAKNTQKIVEKNLQSYRHHVSMSEKINELKGARSSIVKDKITINKDLMIRIRSASKTLLSVNQDLFQTRTKSAVHSLHKCAGEVIHVIDSGDDVPTKLELEIIDALDGAIAILEEEDFTREYRKAE